MDDNNTTVIIIVIVLIIIGLIILFVVLWNNGNTSSDQSNTTTFIDDEDNEDDDPPFNPNQSDTNKTNTQIINTNHNNSWPIFAEQDKQENSSNPGLESCSEASGKVLAEMAKHEDLASVEEVSNKPVKEITTESSEPVHKLLNLEDGSFNISTETPQKSNKVVPIIKPRPIIPQPNKITPYVPTSSTKKQSSSDETSGQSVDMSIINPASGSSDLSTPTTVKINKN